MSPEITITRAVSETHLVQIKELFREYFGWVQSDMQFDLSYQDVVSELMALPGMYGPPQGCLLLASSDDQPAGCVAFRPHTPEICELKRMYVRPAFRGQGIGKLLCSQIIQTARLSGYRLMRLDTEISLSAAHKIYTDFGFHPAAPYYEVPENVRQRTIFMEMDLV
jgi:putative acetyltransferase